MPVHLTKLSYGLPVRVTARGNRFKKAFYLRIIDLADYCCGIPAIMATRALGSRKERLIVTAMVCLAVPCISQTGAFISLLAARSVTVMFAVFIFGLLLMVSAGLFLNRES